MKRIISLLLCIVLMFTCVYTASAADVSEKKWLKMWGDYDENIAPAVTMFVGSDESERYIAWYSETAEGYVELKGVKGTEKIEAQSKASADGGYRLYAVLKGLTDGEYSYTCYSGDFISEEYSFTVEDTDEFTALFVTDIHMAKEEDNENSLAERSYIYNKTLSAAEEMAEERGGSLDLIVSAGDQASEGLTDELIALSSPELMKTVPFAPSVGNHDRKSVGYKAYTALPNENDVTFRSYIGTDYWYRYGDVLFLMFDSCNTSMRAHHKFAKEATKANEDAVWIVAAMHHDMFGGREPWLNTENTLLRFLWMPLFDRYGIDICLYGHSHYYSASNIIFKNETTVSLAETELLTDAEGTLYLSGGSVNNFAPLLDDEGNVPPVGENAAFTYLEEEEPLYTLLDFSESFLEINSYTVDDGENFFSLTLEKSDKNGGHEYKKANIFRLGLTYFVSRIVNVINNSDMYKRYKNQGYDVSLFEGLIGS